MGGGLSLLEGAWLFKKVIIWVKQHRVFPIDRNTWIKVADYVRLSNLSQSKRLYGLPINDL